MSTSLLLSTFGSPVRLRGTLYRIVSGIQHLSSDSFRKRLKTELFASY